MGCGSSSPPQQQGGGTVLDKHGSSTENVENNNHAPQTKNTSNHTGKGHVIENDSLDDRPDSRSTNRDSGIDSAKTNDGRGRNDREQINGVARPVAYDIPLVESEGSIIKRHPPKRFQGLKPKEPIITAELMAEQQRVTEERRHEELQKRAKSARRTSKRRKEIMAARDYEKGQEEQQVKFQQLTDKMSMADKQRARAQQEKLSKLKLREERARQARERARRINQANTEELNFEVEKDDTFNVDDDVDSWLDGFNPNADSNVGSAVSSTSERIYDGRSSPMKRYNPLTSAEVRKRQLGSADYTDDNEMDSGNQWARKSYDYHNGDVTPTNDNFFDS